MLAAREHEVTLWARNPATAEKIQRERRNPHYLSDVMLPDSVRATGDLGDALRDREMVIVAVPSHGVRDVMGRAAAHLEDGAIVVSTVKGIEVETGARMDEVLRECLPEQHHPHLVFLSGPSFAREIADGRPTSVTLACEEEAYAISVQTTLSCDWFRCYSHDDVIGVELGGALKNVIAIAVGICDGLELGLNARAGLMTRGLNEITRLGVRMGAKPTTFMGLSGMGDLVLTCTGDLSRNRSVGLELGRGRSLDEIVSGMNEVAEGIRTTHAACQLADALDVDMPITRMTRAILDGEVRPEQARELLMTRQLTTEHDFVE